jgi:hypothetical protein
MGGLIFGGGGLIVGGLRYQFLAPEVGGGIGHRWGI